MTHAFLSPDSRFLVSCYNNEPVVLNDLSACGLPAITRISDENRVKTSAEFSANGRYLITSTYVAQRAGFGPDLIVWNLLPRIPVQAHLAPESGPVSGFRFWRSGSCLAIAYANGKTVAYDLDEAFSQEGRKRSGVGWCKL